MSIVEQYISNAPVAEAEQPPDNLEPGKYPVKSIGATLRAVSGTNDKGTYAFGDLRVQWQVTAGPDKGQSTWTRLNVCLPDPEGLEDSAYNRILFFTQRLLDVTGLGKRFDPNWAKLEQPHPTKAGKTITKYKGRLLSRANLFDIAENEAKNAEFCRLLYDVVGVANFGVKTYNRADGTEGTENTLKGFEALTDAALKEALAKGATTAAPATSPYQK